MEKGRRGKEWEQLDPPCLALKTEGGGWGKSWGMRKAFGSWEWPSTGSCKKNDDLLVTIARIELCQQPQWVRKWSLSRAFRKDCDPANAKSDIWPYRTVRLHICVILSHLFVAICECNSTKIIQSLITSKLPTVILWSAEKVDTLWYHLAQNLEEPREKKRREELWPNCCSQCQQKGPTHQGQYEGASITPGGLYELPSTKKTWPLFHICFTKLR